MRIPTIRLRHKRKKTTLVVNEQDWSQDLGRFKYRDFERIADRHNEAAAPVNVTPVETPKPEAEAKPPVAEEKPVEEPPRRRRGRPPKNPQ